jgi:hypothetical protein
VTDVLISNVRFSILPQSSGASTDFCRCVKRTSSALLGLHADGSLKNPAAIRAWSVSSGLENPFAKGTWRISCTPCDSAGLKSDGAGCIWSQFFDAEVVIKSFVMVVCLRVGKLKGAAMTGMKQNLFETKFSRSDFSSFSSPF